VQVQSRIEIGMEVRVDLVQPSSSLSKGELKVESDYAKSDDGAERMDPSRLTCLYVNDNICD